MMDFKLLWTPVTSHVNEIDNSNPEYFLVLDDFNYLKKKKITHYTLDKCDHG